MIQMRYLYEAIRDILETTGRSIGFTCLGVDDGSHTKAKNLWGLRCSRAWREFNIRILQEAAEISIVSLQACGMLWYRVSPPEPCIEAVDAFCFYVQAMPRISAERGAPTGRGGGARVRNPPPVASELGAAGEGGGSNMTAQDLSLSPHWPDCTCLCARSGKGIQPRVRRKVRSRPSGARRIQVLT